MKTHQVQINVSVFENEGELDAKDMELLKEARAACQSAYSPYSDFCVGAAIRLEEDIIVTGSNQENAAYPSGLCAERTAVFAASHQYPNKKIYSIAIAAKPRGSTDFLAISPCGSCRQVLSEYENKQDSPIRMIMEGKNKRIYIIESIESLLPLKFSDKSMLL